MPKKIFDVIASNIFRSLDCSKWQPYIANDGTSVRYVNTERDILVSIIHSNEKIELAWYNFWSNDYQEYTQVKITRVSGPEQGMDYLFQVENLETFDYQMVINTIQRLIEQEPYFIHKIPRSKPIDIV